MNEDIYTERSGKSIDDYVCCYIEVISSPQSWNSHRGTYLCPMDLQYPHKFKIISTSTDSSGIGRVALKSLLDYKIYGFSIESLQRKLVDLETGTFTFIWNFTFIETMDDIIEKELGLEY